MLSPNYHLCETVRFEATGISALLKQKLRGENKNLKYYFFLLLEIINP